MNSSGGKSRPFMNIQILKLLKVTQGSIFIEVLV